MIFDLSFIDQATQKRHPKQRYQKPQSLKQLESLCFKAKQAKYPGNPAVIKPSYRDDSANGLTKCIVAWLRLNGHFAARINSTGLYDPRLGKYRPSGARKGMADITAVVNGKHISIEIKIGKDRLRPDQTKIKAEVEAAGGRYLVVQNFDDFLGQIRTIFQSKVE